MATIYFSATIPAMNDTAVRPSLLVADGRDDVRKLLCAVGCHKGFDVVVARDGGEAIQILSTTGFDVVVIDASLPRVSAEDVLAYYHGRYPHMRNVIVTADGPTTVLDRRNVFDIVTRPVDVGRLTQLIVLCAKSRQAA